MRLFLISDNTDSQMGFRLAGIEGVVVHDRESLMHHINLCIADDSIGVVLVTTLLFNLNREVLLDMKISLKRPLIIEVSDRHKSHEVGTMIDDTIAKIVGKVI